MKKKVFHGTLNNFSRFDIRFSCSGGHHFGSLAQARARLQRVDDGISEWRILKCEITLENPIEGLKDIDSWDDHRALAWSILETQDDPDLRAIAHRYEDEPYRFLGEDLPQDQMMEEIKALGYDGAIYGNIGESNGEKSYMIFSDEQVEIIKEI